MAIALPLLVATYRRFRFTDLAYRLMAVHAVVLMVGGYYSYAEVPLGFWVQKVGRKRSETHGCVLSATILNWRQC